MVKMDFFPRGNKKILTVENVLNIKGAIHRGLGYDKVVKKTNNPCYTLRKSTPVLFSKNKKDFLPFSIEDIKKLATFNQSFLFKGNYNQIYALIGNAVPPKFIEAIATKTMLNLKELGINKQDYTVISLFAGCGGSSLGYKMAGFKELLAIDFEKNAMETFKLNFPEVPIWQKDIRQIRGDEILKFCNIKEGELDVLDGSPPCQGFSTAGKRKVYDKRNDLVLEYIRLVDELQPKVFIMENVSGMVKGTMKGLFKEYMLKMKALNYVVKCKLMNAKYYNVPQSRERLIWIGVRKDLGKEGVFPKGNKKLITVKEAFKDCPKDGNVYPLTGKSLKIAKLMKQGMVGSDIMGKGHWFNFRRLDYNRPAYTIRKTGAWLGIPTDVHPIENRALLLSERKRLFSFPDTFNMCKDKPEMYLGNSVPPNFMYAIAKTVRKEILK